MEFLNYYHHQTCGHRWSDVWDCAVDDTCPNCGTKAISPYRSIELDEHGALPDPDEHGVLPDPDNNQRAFWAEHAVRAHTEQVYNMGRHSEDEDTVLHDLLCNLMHWADQRGVDFDQVLQDATAMYDTEVREDGGPAKPITTT